MNISKAFFSSHLTCTYRFRLQFRFRSQSVLHPPHAPTWPERLTPQGMYRVKKGTHPNPSPLNDEEGSLERTLAPKSIHHSSRPYLVSCPRHTSTRVPPTTLVLPPRKQAASSIVRATSPATPGFHQNRVPKFGSLVGSKRLQYCVVVCCVCISITPHSGNNCNIKHFP